MAALLIAGDRPMKRGDELDGEHVVIALCARAVVLILVAHLDELEPVRTKTDSGFDSLCSARRIRA